jgi:pimeloyl-ACP methyl ester carboxylesterase
LTRRTVVVLAVIAALVVGCTDSPKAVPPGDAQAVRTFVPPFVGDERLPPPDLTDDGAGSVIESVAFDKNVDLNEIGAIVRRIVYRSTSGVNGEPTEVSGIVAIPSGDPPRGGWPIVAFGHGTTGVLNECAPSNYPNLLGSGSIVAALVLNGFVVAMTDYQGLGVPGYHHPYLDSTTFGYNMIDAVRAARRVVPDTQTRWAAYGVSLGGMAAWAAADRASTYGDKSLQLVGTAALVPVSDMSGLADEAAGETLTRDQVPLLIYALQALKWSHPELDLDDYRSGAAARNWDTVLQCIPKDFPVEPQRSINEIQPADLRPATQEATDELRTLLKEMALPKQPITGPMLAMYGTADPLVNAAWTRDALATACGQGDTIEIVERIGEGHADLDSSPSLPWVKNRFNGIAPINSCGSAS